MKKALLFLSLFFAVSIFPLEINLAQVETEPSMVCKIFSNQLFLNLLELCKEKQIKILDKIIVDEFSIDGKKGVIMVFLNSEKRNSIYSFFNINLTEEKIKMHAGIAAILTFDLAKKMPSKQINIIKNNKKILI